MKSLSTIKLRVTEGGIDFREVAVLELPIAGDATLVLDRSDLGDIVVKSWEVQPNKEFSSVLERLGSSLRRLFHQIIMLQSLEHEVTGDMYSVKRFLDE